MRAPCISLASGAIRYQLLMGTVVRLVWMTRTASGTEWCRGATVSSARTRLWYVHAIRAAYLFLSLKYGGWLQVVSFASIGFIFGVLLLAVLGYEYLASRRDRTPRRYDCLRILLTLGTLAGMAVATGLTFNSLSKSGISGGGDGFTGLALIATAFGTLAVCALRSKRDS